MFGKILLTVVVVIEAFFFLVGGMLFSLSSNYYVAGAAWAVVISLVIYGFYEQSKRIDQLEKKLRELTGPEEPSN